MRSLLKTKLPPNALLQQSYSQPLYTIPSHILQPTEPHRNGPLQIKTRDEFNSVRNASKLASSTLKMLSNMVKPGISTDQLDVAAFDYITSNNGYPSPLKYRGFPKSISTSVNNVVCHGIPNDRLLKDGDIVNIDVTTFVDGWHGDTSATILVGNVDENRIKLVDCARTALDLAIKECGHGVKLSVIGEVIEEYANRHKYSVNKVFVGHGIGRYFHEEPMVLHYRNKGDEVMVAGMVFTIEPMLNEGKNQVRVWDDGWTAVTIDGLSSAQFEHTLLITEDGVEVLTI